MTVMIALAGKPNAGKSTFFKAATLADVEIANYPFTTIKPNLGVSYVRSRCPSADLKVDCKNCVNGERFTHIELLDVAGLVPEAHLGKGLGNKFLDDMRQAQAVIHVVDASGGTDIEGNVVPLGSHDPLDDIKFLENEITMWMYGILSTNFMKLAKKTGASGGSKIEEAVAEQFAGLGIDDVMVRTAMLELGIEQKPLVNWNEQDMITLSDTLRRVSKPLVIAANKADIAPPEFLEKLKGLEAQGYKVVFCSAGYELALRMAAKNNLIDYLPGDKDFTIREPGKLNATRRPRWTRSKSSCRSTAAPAYSKP